MGRDFPRIRMQAAGSGHFSVFVHTARTSAALKEQHPQVRWAWVDIEDEEEVVGELDIDTFPTILIVQGSTARFLGAQPPQAAVLQRLLQSLQASAGAAAQVDAQAQALWQRLQPWLAQRDS